MTKKVLRTKPAAGPGLAELEANLSKAQSEFDSAKKKLIKAQKELNKFKFKN